MSRVVILGGGESGAGAAVLAQTKGFDTFLSDNGSIAPKHRSLLETYGIAFEENGHTEEKILNADLVIKSPGIPDQVPIVRRILERGIPVISEIEFAGRYDKAKKICITGSNGKTTTTSVIYHLLRNAGLNVGLAGNIGESYAFQVATRNFDIYVLELSSFQLDGMYDFKADIAILLNITPDHLDRYDYRMENYVRSKFRITRNMSPDDCFIFCEDDSITVGHLNEIVLRARKFPFTQQGEVPQGAFLKSGQIIVRTEDDEYGLPVEDLSLSGKHNVYNTMAAAITAKIMHLSNEVIRESLRSFQGVEHRLEKVLSIRDILFINDSKATNVNSAWYALESMTRPVVWIAGGKDKGNDYAPLEPLVREKVRALVCLGKDNRKLHEFFGDKVGAIEDASSAEEAVQKAYALARPGDAVLLSPCCASFDLFKSYEDRGRQFKEAVRKL